MANNGQIPSISPDYYLAGATTTAHGLRSPHRVFLTREEKYHRAEKNFPKAYRNEVGENLPKGLGGIVVIQQGHYPMDFDIVFNPTLKHHCTKQAIMISNKIMRQPYIFASKTYWLDEKKQKLEYLLDEASVLIYNSCERAVSRYIKFKGEDFSVLYMGIQLHTAFNRLEYPYRVWRLQRKNLSVVYVLQSLLNGAMFELNPKDLPDLREAPKEFSVGVVEFKPEGRENDYSRG